MLFFVDAQTAEGAGNVCRFLLQVSKEWDSDERKYMSIILHAYTSQGKCVYTYFWCTHTQIWYTHVHCTIGCIQRDQTWIVWYDSLWPKDTVSSLLQLPSWMSRAPTSKQNQGICTDSEQPIKLYGRWRCRHYVISNRTTQTSNEAAAIPHKYTSSLFWFLDETEQDDIRPQTIQNGHGLFNYTQ